MRSFLLAAVALGAVSVAGGASATVYTADFTGPDLDPSFTITEPSGYVHTVGLGTLVVSSTSHPGTAGNIGAYVTSAYKLGYLTDGDFDAKMTVDTSQLGSSVFYFDVFATYQARASVSSTQALGYISFDPDNGEVVKTVPTVGTIQTLEISNHLSGTSVLVNGELLASYYRQPGLATIVFGLYDWSGEAKTYTAAFVRDFTITTPTLCTRTAAVACGPAVPEPSTWALLLAGFGLTGGLLRARRWRELSAV